VLVVDKLSVHFRTRRGIVQALDRVSLAIEPGEIVGLVGESGSGKSVLSYAISGLLDAGARVVGGEIRWRGTPIGPIRERRTTRAAVVQIFQNPRASLNPIRAVGRQLSDVAGKDRVVQLLESVRLDPDKARSYPFELSGGQCQRVGIALALACEPELLIADEPTTGLDVTTEAAIMKLIADAQHGHSACHPQPASRRGALPPHRRDARRPDRRDRTGRDADQHAAASLFRRASGCHAAARR
jgi:peptide/nickel transport system ATP-binding protein